jgi:O-antigen ligase
LIRATGSTGRTVDNPIGFFPENGNPLRKAPGMQEDTFSRHHRLTWIRILILLEFVAILVSTSAAIVIEFLIYLTILTSRDLLQRLYAIRRQPMIRMTLVWIMVLAASCIYTIAPREDLIDILSSWRKLLLLPMAAAYFGDSPWKQRAIHSIFITLCVLLLISGLTWALDLNVSKYQNGIIVANHAAQGMVFAVCLLLGLEQASEHRNEPIKMVIFLAMTIVAFLNIVFVTPGRSGYLAMIAIVSLYIFFSTSGLKKYLVFFLLIIAMASTLSFSPMARERIEMGLEEIKGYRDSPQLTSMGARMVAWETSIRLIAEKPILGYGSAAYVEAYRRAIAGRSGWQGEVIEDPHNQFLRILVEHGAVGLFFFLLFIGAFFLQSVPRRFRNLGLCVLLTWCATSLFSSHFTTFLEGRFLMLWLGIFLSASPQPVDPDHGSYLAQNG